MSEPKAVTVYYADDTPICRVANGRVQWLYQLPTGATLSVEDARAVAGCLTNAAAEADSTPKGY